MSKFRERAAAVKAAGEAERGNFTPHGAPKRLYDYWLKNTKSEKGAAIRNGIRKENFCHYWRVVAIWAPLLKAGKFLDRNFDRISACIGILFAIALVIAFFVADDTLEIAGWIVLAVLGLASAVAGVIGGISLALTPGERDLNDMPPVKWAIPMAVVGLPTAIISFLVTKAVAFYRKNLTEHTPAIMFGVLSIVVVGVFVIIALEAGVGFMFGILGATLGVLLLGFLAVLGFVRLGRHLEDRRAYAEAQERENPRPVTAKEPREPGKIAKFFRAVGDFLVLLAQVVRVNKWKICPIVEVDTKS